jgi:hypothetical protein
MKDNITKTSLGKGGKSKTDWKSVDALTDEDIARAIANDRDTFEPEPAWFARCAGLTSEPAERAHYCTP